MPFTDTNGFKNRKTKDDLVDISRNIWREIRKGTPFQEPEPECKFGTDFYSLDNSTGADLTALAAFIKKAQGDHSLVFKWDEYVLPSFEETRYDADDFGVGFATTNTYARYTPFEYTDDAGKLVKALFTGRLNKNICYLENDAYLQRSFSINYNYNASTLTASLNIYYDNQTGSRTDIVEDNGIIGFNVEDQYTAIQLSTDNLADFIQLVKYLYGKSGYIFITYLLTKWFAIKIKQSAAAGDLDLLHFFYKRLPDFVIESLQNFIDKDTLLQHLALLEIRDEINFFVDSSAAAVKLLRAINDPEFLYDYFLKNPVYVKQILFNFDKSSTFEGVEIPNKLIFAIILLSLCQSTKFKGFPDPYKKENSEKLPVFRIGKNYKVDTNVLPGNDKYDSLYTMTQQEGQNHTYFDKTLEEEVTETLYKDVDPTGFYHPLQPVYFIDLRSHTIEPMLVPAIYVKAIAHMNEVGEIMKTVRVLADLVIIITGIFTFGSSSMIMRIFTLLDIGMATADLIIIGEEDELMKTEKGREFLENWSRIMLAGGIAAASVVAITAAYKCGAWLLGNLTKTTLNQTDALLKASIRELLLQRSATFLPESLEILNAAEANTVFGLTTFSKAEMKTLYEAGVVFAKGDVKVGKKVAQEIAAVYNGKLIAIGKEDIKLTLATVKTTDGATFVKQLDELPEIKPIASEGDLLDTWDSLPVSQRGRRLGQRLLKKEINWVKKFLTTLGYELEIFPTAGAYKVQGFMTAKNTPYILSERAQAAFIYTAKKAKFCLRQNCTVFEFFHEFMHGRHAKELGLSKYYKLGGSDSFGEGTLIKEQYVFDKIVEYKDLFTQKELEHSLNYINDVRLKKGQNALSFSFDIEAIPVVRKEISIDNILKIK